MLGDRCLLAVKVGRKGRYFENGGVNSFRHPALELHRCPRHQTLRHCITGLRIGHTRLTHGYVMSRDYQPCCDDCLVPLTVRHLLIEYPILIDSQHHYLYRCRSRGNCVYYLLKVLGPSSLVPGYSVLGFLEEAGLLSRL